MANVSKYNIKSPFDQSQNKEVRTARADKHNRTENEM